MASGARSGRKYGAPAKHQASMDGYVSPQGSDPAQTPSYSPAHGSELGKPTPTGRRASQSESARNARRGED